MKKYILLSFVCCVIGLFSSCNYLNVDDYFEDTFQEDSIFSNKTNLEYYYNGAVALLPKEGRLWHWGSTPGVTGSDEAVSSGSFPRCYRRSQRTTGWAYRGRQAVCHSPPQAARRPP